MKILIFTHNYPVESGERRNAGIFVQDLACELAKTNSVSVVCPGIENKKCKIRGIDVRFFSWGRNKHLGRLRLWNPIDIVFGFNLFLQGIKTLLIAVRESRPDVTIGMWAVPGGLFAYFTKVVFKTPYAVWVLGSDFYVYAKYPVVRWLIIFVLQQASSVFADGISLSKEVAQVIKRKCLFLPSTININTKLAATPKRDNLKKTVLTFIGRMESIKGPDILLTAALDVRIRKPLEVHFIGSGTLLASLKQVVGDNSNNSIDIIFHGNISEKEKVLILSQTDWLIIPSRSDSIPLVFSEAMKLNIPVIASDLADLKYLVNKYKVGYVFKSGEMKELAKVIERLPVRQGIRKVFVKNTKQAAEIFSIKQSAKRLVGYMSHVKS